MVKSGLQKCIDTYDADLAVIEKNCLYDSEDYASVYLQVIKSMQYLFRLKDIINIFKISLPLCRQFVDCYIDDDFLKTFDPF